MQISSLVISLVLVELLVVIIGEEHSPFGRGR
jgi:hypothetical protein